MGKIQRSVLWAQAFLVLTSMPTSISIHALTPSNSGTHLSIAATITQPHQNDRGFIPSNIGDNNHSHGPKQHIPDSIFAVASPQLPEIPQLGISLANPLLSLDFLESSQNGEETFEKSQLQTLGPATVSHPPHHTQPEGPPISAPRPARKPSLLTDYEYESMWDPQPDTIRFGVLLPLNAIDHYLEASTVRKTLSAIRMAVDDINKQCIIPGANVTLVLRDSQSPDLFTPSGGAAAISGAGSLINARVAGVIGDITSDLTRYEALMTSSVKISQCSYASINTLLSDDVMYPWFFRTIPTTIVVLDAVLDTILRLGWRRITLIYDIEVIGWAGREYFAGRAKKLGIYVLGYQAIRLQGQENDPTFQFIKDKIDSSQSRIQLLVAVGRMQMQILREMKKSGYLGPEYGWVTTNEVSESIRNEPDYDEYDGLIMIDNHYDLKGHPAYDKFMAQWMALDINDYPGAAHEVVNSNEAMAYSCVMMIANAYGDFVRMTIGNNASISDPFLREIMAGDHTEDIHVSTFYSNKPYIGPSGRILLDSNGDRQEGPYQALSLQNGKSIPFALIFGSNYTSLMPPPFKSTQKRLPSDAPVWAIQNPRWSNTVGKIMGTLCIFAILLTVATSSMVIIYQHCIVIKAASPVFCLFELLGLLLVYIWCFLQVGIPSSAICNAQAFILPLGATLLTGSLTFKNYRIYRIFNSITVTNRIFHTRRLLKFLAGAVSLTVILSTVEVAVYPPIPTVINSNYYQWIRCSSSSAGAWRMLVTTVIPIFLVIFGVFLAFKTRNVMFLWNEAREISLVLYNIFFFGLLIVIFQFFDEDLYIATFYMTFAGIFFTATFALLCLFLPKFWRLINSHEERDRSNTTHNLCEGGPSHEQQPRVGSTGYLLADGTVGGGGGGLGGFGGGDLGGVGGIYASAHSSVLSAQTLGRMPDDLNFASFPITTSTFTRSQLPKTKTPSGNQGRSDDAAAAARFDLSDSVDVDLTLQSTLQPLLTGANTTSQEQGTQRKRRRRSDALSVASSSHLDKHSGNPIELWMSTKLPRKKSGVDPLSTIATHNIKDSTLSTGSSGHLPHPQPQFVQRDFSDDVSLGGGRSRRSKQRLQEECGGGGTGEFPVPFSFQGRAFDIHSSAMPQGLDSGIDRCMDSFMFLVPIRVKKSRITGVLSHWCMATLILIPEAHAFLALDSVDQKSTSYLMVQMVQDHSTPDEPTIRVNTCHNGTLFIRFETQSKLDAWMALFNEEDLNALRPRSSSTCMLPSTLSTSSFDQFPPPMLLNDNHGGSGGILGSGNVQDSEHDISQSGAHGSRHTSMVTLPAAAAAGGEGLKEGDSLMRPSMNMTTTDYPNHPQQQQQQQISWKDDQTGVGGNDKSEPDFSHAPGEPGNKINYQNYDTTSMNTLGATGATPMVDSRPSRQRNYNNASATDNVHCLTSIPTIPSSALSPPCSSLTAQPQPPQHQPPSSTLYDTLPLNFATTTNTIDDDDDDLYDPEFGIGGNGRRRFPKKNCSAVGRCGSGITSSTASSARSSMVVSSSSTRRSLSQSSVDPTRGNNSTYHTLPAVAMIPAAAVISTAAAAVAAGWKESDALVAATADPSGSFLAGYNITSPHPSQNPGKNKRNSNRNRRKSPGTGGTAGTRESPDRKSFGDFRRHYSLSSGLSLLASGRRSLGQIFSDRSGNSNSNGKGNSNGKNTKLVAVAASAGERSLEVVEPVGKWNDKVLSYSQYLARTQATAASQSQQQQASPRALSQIPIAPKAEFPIAPPLATVFSTASGSEPAVCPTPVMAVPLRVEDEEVAAPQVNDKDDIPTKSR